MNKIIHKGFSCKLFSFFLSNFIYGSFWIRIPKYGYGISFSNSTHIFFSERYGYTKYKIIGNWKIKILRPERKPTYTLVTITLANGSEINVVGGKTTIEMEGSSDPYFLDSY